MKGRREMGLEEVTPEDHAHWITLAEKGCIEAAALLMSDASIYIQHSIPLPEPLGGYIGEALYKAARINAPDVVDANTAFNLNKGRGRNKYTETLQQHLICMEVQLEWLDIGRYAESAKGIGAYNKVAAKYGYDDPDSIARVFQKRKSDWNIKEQTREELRAGIVDYRRYLKKNKTVNTRLSVVSRSESM